MMIKKPKTLYEFQNIFLKIIFIIHYQNI